MMAVPRLLQLLGLLLIEVASNQSLLLVLEELISLGLVVLLLVLQLLNLGV
jgi:hypothetical protein